MDFNLLKFFYQISYSHYSPNFFTANVIYYTVLQLYHYIASYSVTCVTVLLDKGNWYDGTSVIYSDAFVIEVLNEGQEIIKRFNIMYVLKVSQQSCLACSTNDLFLVLFSAAMFKNIISRKVNICVDSTVLIYLY